MSARDRVLKRIATALDRPAIDAAIGLAEQPDEVRQRLLARHRHTLPAVADPLITTLVNNMQSVLTSVKQLGELKDCVAAVDHYLQSMGIDGSQPGVVCVAPAMKQLSWPGHFRFGAATGVERVSITPCLAAVAETGSVVLVSSGETPATLNFLPEVHIVVVYESQVVKHVDDVFALTRALPTIPRAVSFVTGPSRTADIEQTLEIGAHGPRQVHVLLIAGGPH